MPDQPPPNKRAIDDRLDALTMSLQLQVGIQRDSDARMAAGFKAVNAATVKMFAGVVM